LLLAAVDARPLVATLIFIPWPAETVEMANFRAIRVGMSQSELRKSWAHRDLSVELGLVSGPTTYAVNFVLDEDEMRARGFQAYLRQVWISPQITITLSQMR